MSALTDENSILKCKAEALEGLVQTMKREMQTMQSALGPWYRSGGSYPALSRQTSSPEQSFQTRASIGSPPEAGSYIPFSPPPHASTSTTSDALAPYFPPETDETLPWLERRLNFHMSSDVNGRLPHTPVAPVNLSTTLEGSLAGLRESIVTLSASVDSLARRHDIELRNETLRANEEISRLNYTMHGLRMQVSRFRFVYLGGQE
jgi:hypothetical protein